MAIEVKGIDKVVRKILTEIDKIELKLVRNMMYLGEQCVNIARQQGSYIDRTGNLRSSTGYVLVNDGKVITVSPFEQVKDGVDGSFSGRNYALELAKQVPQGLVLIVVAGRKYAKYVADRGYDVLDSAELFAEKQAPKIMQRLGISKN